MSLYRVLGVYQIYLQLGSIAQSRAFPASRERHLECITETPDVRKSNKMATFIECLEYAKEKVKFTGELKDKQAEILHKLYVGKDCIGILPTGYGKSLIFQMLPFFLQRKFGLAEPKLVLVMCPLNSLMEDQCLSLRERGIKACVLNIEGTKGFSYQIGKESTAGDDTDSDSDLDGEEIGGVYIPKSVPYSDVEEAKLEIIYGHPETMFTGKTMPRLLRSSVYQERVGAVIIDEVHMITEW